jgi:hypothetical protein
VPWGVAVDNADNVYVSDMELYSRIWKISGENATVFVPDWVIPLAWDLGFAPDGNLYVADQYNYQIRRVSTAGVVTTIAGGSAFGDGTGTGAGFSRPTFLGVRSDGMLLVSEFHRLRWVTPDGVVTTAAGAPYIDPLVNKDGTGVEARLSAAALAIGPDGDAFFGTGRTIRRVTETGVVTTYAGSLSMEGAVDGPLASARFTTAKYVAADFNGGLYIGESELVRYIKDGSVKTVAGVSKSRFVTDGTGSGARFASIRGLTVTRDGNVYVAEATCVRRVTPAGVVTTIAGDPQKSGFADGVGKAARFRWLTGIAADKDGTVYVADAALTSPEANHSIRKILPDGTVTTIAGQPLTPGLADGASTGRIMAAYELAVDGEGGVVFADYAAGTLRRINLNGEIETIAGLAEAIGLVDGSGDAARLITPRGVAIDSRGRIWFMNEGTVRIATPAACPSCCENPLSSAAVSITGPADVCQNSMGGTASATIVGGGAVTRQWGWRMQSGGTVTPIAGATGTSLEIDPSQIGEGKKFLVCTVTPECGSPVVTNEIAITIHGSPEATIYARSSTSEHSTGNEAAVQAGPPGTVYEWSIINGTITEGAGSRRILWTAGPAPSPTEISVKLTAPAGCSSSSTTSVSLFSAVSPAASFYTVTPCRLVDSRFTDRPALGGVASRIIQAGGRCGVPLTAKSVSLNVTVVPSMADGHLTLHPSDRPMPLASTLNYAWGRVRANNAIIRLSADGTLTVFNGGAGPTDFILDVNGYFE